MSVFTENTTNRLVAAWRLVCIHLNKPRVNSMTAL